MQGTKAWSCYLLYNTAPVAQRTYIGVTVDLARRLRQHNGEISGGASATRSGTWTRYMHISGFADERASLQVEWAWKYVTKSCGKMEPLHRRIRALKVLLLDKEKATSKAIPYSEFEAPLVLKFERAEAWSLWQQEMVGRTLPAYVTIDSEALEKLTAPASPVTESVNHQQVK